MCSIGVSGGDMERVEDAENIRAEWRAGERTLRWRLKAGEE